jgi:hypothetical protein
MTSLHRALVLVLLITPPSIAPNAILAQQVTPTQPIAKPAAQAPAKQAPKGAQPPPAPAPQPQVSVEQVLYLVRSTLLTLNDANRSGNYSVLRDLAAPGFQAKNTAADLAQAFTDLRRRKFDLFGVALIAPQLTAAPTVDGNGRLVLSGVFATRPQQIKFDLMFEVDAGQWKLFGIAVATPEAPPLEAQAQGTPQQTPTQQPTATAEPKRPAKGK